MFDTKCCDLYLYKCRALSLKVVILCKLTSPLLARQNESISYIRAACPDLLLRASSNTHTHTHTHTHSLSLSSSLVSLFVHCRYDIVGSPASCFRPGLAWSKVINFETAALYNYTLMRQSWLVIFSCVHIHWDLLSQMHADIPSHPRDLNIKCVSLAIYHE